MQMDTITRNTLVLIFSIFFTGCSIKHFVSDDYTQYLNNNEGGYQLPITDLEAKYLLTPKTVNHSYEFRAATTGYANLWIVKFGEILEKTLQSKDVQAAFKKLTKSSDGNSTGTVLIKFNLVDYTFEGFEARVTLQVSVLKDDQVIFDETYFEKGKSQGGKMFWAGAFGMKNAIQQSTKNAIDKILARSLDELMTHNLQSD